MQLSFSRRTILLTVVLATVALGEASRPTRAEGEPIRVSTCATLKPEGSALAA